MPQLMVILNSVSLAPRFSTHFIMNIAVSLKQDIYIYEHQYSSTCSSVILLALFTVLSHQLFCLHVHAHKHTCLFSKHASQQNVDKCHFHIQHDLCNSLTEQRSACTLFNNLITLNLHTAAIRLHCEQALVLFIA